MTKHGENCRVFTLWRLDFLMASWFAASQLLGGDFVSGETTVTCAEIVPKVFWLVNVSGHRPTIILSPGLARMLNSGRSDC